MDFIKIVFFFFALVSMPFSLFAQTDNLRIGIYHDIYDETPCLQLTILSELDTVYSRTISDEYEVLINDLDIGKYVVSITNCGSESDE